MKQNITENQWDELSENQQKIFEDFMGYICSNPWNNLNIGELIEFLGKDLKVITRGGRWFVCIETRGVLGDDELVDALFEAVKFKLNN